MRYVGGKTKIASWVAEHILALPRRPEYLEPCVGSGATFVKIAPHHEKAFASDSHEDLILLWQAIATGWDPPEYVSRELYDSLRKAEPSALRGFVGFGSSFSGKWFGGYVDSPWDSYHQMHMRCFAAAARDSLIAAREVFRIAEIKHQDYKQLKPSPEQTIYADVPYKGTLGYSGTKFDIDEFWEVASSWHDAGAQVVVSEMQAPSGWRIFAERDRAAALRIGEGKAQPRRAERLYVHI